MMSRVRPVRPPALNRDRARTVVWTKRQYDYLVDRLGPAPTDPVSYSDWAAAAVGALMMIPSFVTPYALTASHALNTIQPV